MILALDTNGNVVCQTKLHNNCKGTNVSLTTKNCLNSPDDNDFPGFGCPGKDFTSQNMPPIDPKKNNGKVCKYYPQ